jgi:hypothetical protein
VLTAPSSRVQRPASTGAWRQGFPPGAHNNLSSGPEPGFINHAAKNGDYNLDKAEPIDMVNAPSLESGAGAPDVIKLSARQIRDGRNALRDWLASGRDSLTVSNTSLDMALREVVQSLFRREVEFCS